MTSITDLLIMEESLKVVDCYHQVWKQCDMWGDHWRQWRDVAGRWDGVGVWENIEPELCQKFTDSMPRRLEEVTKAKEGNTKC